MTSMTSRSAADVLLELLGKVPDATTLEILLEPKHLLPLLRTHGWTDDEIRRDLTRGGRLPGELLLAVLAKQPDSAVLLAQLGNPAPPAPSTRKPPPRTGVKAVPAIVFGALLAGASGWILFVKLQVLSAPGLIVHFPGAYTLLFSALVGGLLLIGAGVRAHRRK